MLSISPEGGEGRTSSDLGAPRQPSRPQWCHGDSSLALFSDGLGIVLLANLITTSVFITSEAKL